MTNLTVLGYEVELEEQALKLEIDELEMEIQKRRRHNLL